MIKTSSIIVIVFTISIYSCTTNASSKAPSKIVDSLFVENKSDSVYVNEYYQGIIYIPEFDSTKTYSCIIGDNEIVKISENDYKLQITGTSYDSIPYVPGFDIFMIVRKHTQIGKYVYNGFIREESKNKEFVYYPFSAYYFVLPPTSPSKQKHKDQKIGTGSRLSDSAPWTFLA